MVWHKNLESQEYLAKERAKERNVSAKLATPTCAVTQLRNLSNRLCILKALVRRALYSEALRSAAHRFARASSLASCRQFSKCTQFNCLEDNK